MRILSQSINLNNNGNTFTEKHLGEYLGEKPERLGLMASMRPDLTFTLLTESLRNTVMGNKLKKGTYKGIHKMAFEWQIKMNKIKRVPFAQNAVISSTNLGAYSEEFSVFTPYKYYNKGDTFALENKQLLFVTKVPTMLGSNLWEVKVKLVAQHPTDTVDVNYLSQGKMTLYRSNFWPELSREGYNRMTYDYEWHRNYMGLHKHGATMSQRFSNNKTYYINDADRVQIEAFEIEKEIMNQFLETREGNIAYQESNFDEYGRCQLQDENGQDIPMGDGVIPQAKRYANLFSYNTFDTSYLDMMIQSATAKSTKITGNKYVFACNTRMYHQFGSAMKQDNILSNFGAWFFSKNAKDPNGLVNVGANFNTYSYQGNEISLMPSMALNVEYPDQGYGILIGMDPDMESGKPAMEMFTQEGAEYLTGNLIGMGGKDGHSSGEISTPVTGTEYYVMGYSGVALYNPYNTAIIQEN